MSWLLIPLDDRPCCANFARQLLGPDLLLPPRPLLGHFQEPGRSEALLDWLEGEAPPLEGVVTSTDMLAWGGLVASRRGGKDLPSALGRIDRFLDLGQRRGWRLLAFQTIMRNAPTQLQAQDMHWAELLVELSLASAGADHERSRRLREQIPSQVLQDYLEARACNFRLYQALVQRQSEFEALVFALDDSKTAGWNLEELARLGPVESLPGTDETALLLLTRVLAGGREFEVHWSFPGLENFQGLYEDRPLGALLEAHLRVARLKVGSPCSRQLWLYARPHQPQIEACSQTALEPDPVWLDSLARSLDQGHQVMLLDCTFANGGDLSLGEALEKSGLLYRLHGYAAWNTLGNRLGTALANLTLPLSQQQQRDFLVERWLDDLHYQADLRWRAARLLGHPGLSLSQPELLQVQTEIFPELQKRYSNLCRRFEQEPRHVSFRLPWQRLFELEVQQG